MATNSGVSVFNYVRNNSSSGFREAVPQATVDNIAQLSNILFNQNYTPMLNEFVSNLINRIGFTMISNKVFNNPLSIFRKGSVPLGTDIQDIFTNPAQAETYEYSDTAMSKLLTITDPDTKVAYYRRNRQDLYTVTVTREGLQGAFTSWENFESYIASLVDSLYSGNYIDEFKYTKELIYGAYVNNKAIMSQATFGTTQYDKALAKFLRKTFNLMKFPSSNYNAYSVLSGDVTKPVVTWTDESRIVLLIRADVLADVDIEVMASAFNLDKADFMGRVITVDNFGDDNILGVVCDESFFQIYQNQFRFDEFYNARTMSWNYYLHAWDTFALSPFANHIMLVRNLPVPATSITLGEIGDVTIGTPATATVSLSPNNSTSKVTVTSSDESVATVSITTNTVTVTGVSAGTCTITVKTDNGKTDSEEIEVKEAETNNNNRSTKKTTEKVEE